MLLSLPPELLISVFRFLPLPDISSCIQTSRALKLFIDQYESTIYRQAAAHPSFRLIPHDQLLFSELIPLGLLSKRYIGDASDWKSLCGCLPITRRCVLSLTVGARSSSSRGAFLLGWQRPFPHQGLPQRVRRLRKCSSYQGRREARFHHHNSWATHYRISRPSSGIRYKRRAPHLELGFGAFRVRLRDFFLIIFFPLFFESVMFAHMLIASTGKDF